MMISDHSWLPSKLLDRAPENGIRHNLFQAAWTPLWGKTTSWLQILFPAICLVLDGLSDQAVPSSVIWTAEAQFEPIRLTSYYNGVYVAYWSNIGVMVIGLLGVLVYSKLKLVKPKNEQKAKMLHSRLSIIGAVLCALSTVFTVGRWQVISMTFLNNGDTSLETPFILSILTCFLQVIPGSASLFAPVLMDFTMMEAKRFTRRHSVKACQGNTITQKLETLVSEVAAAGTKPGPPASESSPTDSHTIAKEAVQNGDPACSLSKKVSYESVDEEVSVESGYSNSKLPVLIISNQDTNSGYIRDMINENMKLLTTKNENDNIT